MLKKINFLLLIIVGHFLTAAGSLVIKITPEQYIENYKEDAIIGMNKYKIPASITLAQGMLESGNGNSPLAVNANNHFGIKCHNDWKGATYIMDDDKKDECFRKYSSVLDSYNDHAQFLSSRSNYTKLFELKITDYKGWAKGLKEAGYATDPKYPKRLIDIIEKYELFKYDSAGKKTKKTKKHNDIKPFIVKENQELRETSRLGIRKYIIIKEGDTFEKIAKETDKDLWQLYKYNDLKASDKLIPGDKLFLQPKRNRAKEPFHIVKSGETMRSISQMYGIKLRSLYRKNDIEPGQELKIGDTLYMKKHKPSSALN